MKDKEKYNRVLKYANSLMSSCDCSCEFNHYNCSTMRNRHGHAIMSNVLGCLEEGGERISDKVLVTGCIPFLSNVKTSIKDLEV